MKFAVVLVLALCHVAVLSAYECGGCNLDGKWRTTFPALHADDDDIIGQLFDGQVEWREEYAEFQVHLAAFISTLNSEVNNQAARDLARQSCKEAIPDRVYNFRFEREIDDIDYELNLYLYAGYQISEKNWDRYCTLLLNTDYNGDSSFLFVPTEGETAIDRLKGAWQRKATGIMVHEGGSNCNANFLAREIKQACMMKNDANRFPTEIFCGIESPGQISQTTSEHAFGGAHTHSRYGCHQYTWDSDTNDDNINESWSKKRCDNMYFVNSYSGMDNFKLGNLIPGATGTTYLSALVGVNTPGNLCERKVTATGWSDLTRPSDHPCQ